MFCLYRLLIMTNNVNIFTNITLYKFSISAGEYGGVLKLAVLTRFEPIMIFLNIACLAVTFTFYICIASLNVLLIAAYFSWYPFCSSG